MNKPLLLSIITSVVAVVMVATPVFAAPPTTKGNPDSGGGGGGKTSSPLGLDVSWPQCDTKLPSDFAFAIIGVNGGLASNTNECLASQLDWAQGYAGGTSQPGVQLYVNTGNPYEDPAYDYKTWPTFATANNPYQECNNDDSLGCAWQYGYNRAQEDVDIRFIPAAQVAGVDAQPENYVWWLDVETMNSWRMNGSAYEYDTNVAVLEGMNYYLQQRGLQVGLYSTGSQWQQITGNRISESSSLNGSDNWRPGGAGLATAKQACSADPLTDGGVITLTQFIKKGLDYNYSCQG